MIPTKVQDMALQARPMQRPSIPHSDSRRAAPRSRRRPTPWLLVGGLTASALAVVMALVASAVYLLAGGETIAAGVTVGDVSIGGLSVERAEQRVLSENWAARPVMLADGDRTWTLSLSELGVRVDAQVMFAAARRAPAGSAIAPWYTIDLSRTEQALIALSEQANIAPVTGDEPQMGRALDVPAMLNRLYQNLQGELADGRLDLMMIEVAPPEPEPTEVEYTGEASVHVVERGQELGLIARQYGVDVQSIVSLNEMANPDLLYIGQELLIPAAGVYQPSAADAPPAPTSAGKSILVSTSDQRIYAYENGQLVRSHLVSTGLPATPTVRGDYRVYVKYVADDMSGPDYYLPQVPYTMYFYQGYAIHGTYWHNAFGRPMSHGCVNLPVSEAQWFFEFAEVGTPVRVI